jgi:hypothetical protein
MKLIALSCFLMCGVVFAEDLAPKLKPLSHEEIGIWVGKVVPEKTIEKSIIRRGLISSQTALRADCARYLATHGDLSDIPYLIDKLSDESMHVGASYPHAGMSTTRYWANVALICICKIDVGYRWDDPIEKRTKQIESWKNHWSNAKIRLKKKG